MLINLFQCLKQKWQKKSPNEKRIIVSMISNIIQFSIFVGIFATCILTLCSIRQQENFYRDSKRPWITFYPDSNIILFEGKIDIQLFLKNIGYTPANISRFVYFCAIDNNFTKENVDSSGSYSIFHGDARYKRIYLEVPSFKERILSKDSFQTLLENEKIFMHFYVDYEDLSKKKYSYYAVYLLDYIGRFPEGFKCEWKLYYTSHKMRLVIIQQNNLN